MVEEIDYFIRGGVYIAKLYPVKYNEIGKLRPVVILNSQNILSNNPTNIFICPLSSQSKEDFKHLHFYLQPRDRLEVGSYALVEHCKSISYERIIKSSLCVLSTFELDCILEKLLFLLGKY
jgi:mRNA interferase MazF